MSRPMLPRSAITMAVTVVGRIVSTPVKGNVWQREEQLIHVRPNVEHHVDLTTVKRLVRQTRPVMYAQVAKALASPWPIVRPGSKPTSTSM